MYRCPCNHAGRWVSHCHAPPLHTHAPWRTRSKWAAGPGPPRAIGSPSPPRPARSAGPLPQSSASSSSCSGCLRPHTVSRAKPVPAHSHNLANHNLANALLTLVKGDAKSPVRVQGMGKLMHSGTPRASATCQPAKDGGLAMIRSARKLDSSSANANPGPSLRVVPAEVLGKRGWSGSSCVHAFHASFSTRDTHGRWLSNPFFTNA
jgi:hypothetical protein